MLSFFISLSLLILVTLSHVSCQTWNPVSNGVSVTSVTTSSSTTPSTSQSTSQSQSTLTSTLRTPVILIGYAGWSVSLKNSQAWLTQVIEKSVDVIPITILQVYAVKGPIDSMYRNPREIGNTALATSLIASLSTAPSNTLIIILAHSSGSYVAQELLSHLYIKGLDKDGITKNKIVYYNLDGGLGASSQILTPLKGLYYVFASDSVAKIVSKNTRYMRAGALSHGTLLELSTPSSGCLHPHCLHDTMIITAPYNPHTFDLVHDYTAFTEQKQVQLQFFEKTKHIYQVQQQNHATVNKNLMEHTETRIDSHITHKHEIRKRGRLHDMIEK